MSDFSDAISRARPRAGSGARSHDRRHPILSAERAMLKWALIFAVIALVAGLFGFTGIEAGAADIAKTLFYLFVGIVVVFLALGLTIFRNL
jgi:uncharacterized membrane protein YtjA (UPF0391 family)